MEVNGLFSLFGLPVTAYALFLVAALAAGLLRFFRDGKKRGIGPDALWRTALLSLPLGLIGARLFFCVCQIRLYEEMGLEAVFRLWEGGYALWGAVGGVLLAAFIAARTSGEKTVRLLDALAPAAALTICICRLAEYFSGEGIGLYVEDEALQWFPLAVMNEYEEWYFAVFLLEALAALVICAVLLRKQRKDGDTAKLFFLLYSACQIVLESLRRDNFLRWLFVRVSQLTALLVIVGLMAAALARWVKHKEDRRMTGGEWALCWAVVLSCTGLCIALEFSVDGKIWAELPVGAAYALMACCCAGIGAAAYRTVFHSLKDA